MSEPTQPKLSPDPSDVVRPRVVRRRYLIDPKRQLRTAVVTTSLTATLVFAVNVGFHMLRSLQTAFIAAAAPQLTPLLEKQGATFSLSMILISVALVIAVALTTIVQTHHTAGAVHAVRQRFERVREGDLQVMLKLRQRDTLQDLEAPFNEMVAALRDRAVEDAEALEKLAVRAAEIGPKGTDLAADLSAMAQHKRQVGT